MSRNAPWADVNIHMLREEELVEAIADLRELVRTSRNDYAVALRQVVVTREALDAATYKLRAHEGNLARRDRRVV